MPAFPRYALPPYSIEKRKRMVGATPTSRFEALIATWASLPRKSFILWG